MKAVLVAAALTGVAPAAVAAPASETGRQCFYSRDVTSWRAVGSRQVNIQVNHRDVYRLDLVAACPQLSSAGETIGLVPFGASDQVCLGIEVDVVVPQRGLTPIPCPVKTITRLSPAEAKALPKRQRP